MQRREHWYRDAIGVTKEAPALIVNKIKLARMRAEILKHAHAVLELAYFILVRRGGRRSRRKQSPGNARAIGRSDGCAMPAGIHLALDCEQHLFGAAGTFFGDREQRIGDVKNGERSHHRFAARALEVRRKSAKAAHTSGAVMLHCQT